VLLAALYVGGTVYAVVVLIVAIAGLIEAMRLFRVPVTVETVAAGLFGLAAWLTGPMLGDPALTWPSVASFGALLLARQVLRFPVVTNQDLAGVALAATYVGLPFAHFFLLRGLEAGVSLTLVAFLLTWVFDTAAYFAGMQWGKHRLAPAVSPGKTWEGAIAGAVATVAFAGIPFSFWSIGLGPRLAAAAAVIVFGQLGDLAESAMKRHASVKDSGRLLPGHGGILDRFDSLMLSLPAVYYLVRLLPARFGG
jgi:phosphatidate cytidylyltransferase